MAVKKSGSPPPSWVSEIDPSPDWATSMVEEAGGWQIEARWWGSHGEAVGTRPGPREVVIRPARDIEPAVLQRGVTTGVMRRLEGRLSELVASLHQRPDVAKTDAKYRAALERRVRSLPEGGPRSRPEDYYGALLDLFEEISVISHRPIKDIAEAMGVSPETVRTRLAAARQRRRRDATPR